MNSRSMAPRPSTMFLVIVISLLSAVFGTGTVLGFGQDEERKDVIYRGKTVAVWLKLLKDKDPKTHQTAIAALIEVFQDREAQVASDAAEALAAAGSEAVPSLIEAMKRPEPSIRAFAASALGYMHPPAKEAIR